MEGTAVAGDFNSAVVIGDLEEAGDAPRLRDAAPTEAARGEEVLTELERVPRSISEPTVPTAAVVALLVVAGDNRAVELDAVLLLELPTAAPTPVAAVAAASN
jgi:hypothetical protein